MLAKAATEYSQGKNILAPRANEFLFPSMLTFLFCVLAFPHCAGFLVSQSPCLFLLQQYVFHCYSM